MQPGSHLEQLEKSPIYLKTSYGFPGTYIVKFSLTINKFY